MEGFSRPSSHDISPKLGTGAEIWKLTAAYPISKGIELTIEVLQIRDIQC